MDHCDKNYIICLLPDLLETIYHNQLQYVYYAIFIYFVFWAFVPKRLTLVFFDTNIFFAANLQSIQSHYVNIFNWFDILSRFLQPQTTSSPNFSM